MSQAIPSPTDVQISEAGLPRRNHPFISIFLIFLLWISIYFAGMFTPPLMDDVDTIHAEAHTVFLWSDQEDPKELYGLQRYALARSGGKHIFTNVELRR